MESSFEFEPPLPYRTLFRCDARLSDWRSLDVSTPQGAFSTLPRQAYERGEVRPRKPQKLRIWIIGAGDNPTGQWSPDDLDIRVNAGDGLWGGVQDTLVAGAFNDEVVDDWRMVLHAVEEAERKMLLLKREQRSEGSRRGAATPSSSATQPG